MEHDAGAAQVSVCKLLCPLSARPEPVFKNDVRAVLKQGQGVPIRDQLEPVMKMGVLMRDHPPDHRPPGAFPP